MLFSDGPLTSLLIAGATSAGAGILLGGLMAGLVGVARSRDGGELELATRRAGYWGGLWGLTAPLLDSLIL